MNARHGMPGTRPLRLLLSSHGSSPFGAERVLLILAQGLADRGHHVTLEYPHEGPALDEARTLDGLDVWLSDRPRLPRNVREAGRYALGGPAALYRLWRRIRRGQYDVVWVNSLYNPLAAIAARTTGIGVVWYVHERRFQGPIGVGAAWLARACSHELVTVSRFVADTFEATPFVNGCRVLHAQTEILSPDPLPDANPFVVGYLGQLEDRKRVTDVLRALAELPDVDGLIVGAGKRSDANRAEASELGLDRRVWFPGFQSDVADWYRRMHCVVIPSPDEACPLVAMEAMSAGRPVIAADHGGLPEVLKDAALFYPLGDVDALRSCVERLRRDVDLRDQLVRRGLDRVQAFDREAWLDRAEAITRDVVKNARGGT